MEYPVKMFDKSFSNEKDLVCALKENDKTDVSQYIKAKFFKPAIHVYSACKMYKDYDNFVHVFYLKEFCFIKKTLKGYDVQMLGCIGHGNHIIPFRNENSHHSFLSVLFSDVTMREMVCSYNIWMNYDLEAIIKMVEAHCNNDEVFLNGKVYLREIKNFIDRNSMNQYRKSYIRNIIGQIKL